MSAIVGVYHRDLQGSESTLQHMVSVLSHRGPDGSAIWSEGAIGLGHCKLIDTPESCHEQLPRFDPNRELAITADARIDNREELLSSFRLSRNDELVTDSDLILASYERWGEDCPKYLLGDFAFAIWDRRREQLFLARDHLGVKQLYYTDGGSNIDSKPFGFASEIKALFALPGFHESIDESILGAFLATGKVDSKNTVFSGVRRLLPGHIARIAERGTQLRTYWSPQRVPQEAASDREYAEQFREIFTEAVRCRLRSAHPIASELSGGLDSTFVTCVARDLLAEQNRGPLHTISLIYEQFTESDERPFINEVLKESAGIEPHFEVVERNGLVGLLDEIYDFLDDGRAAGNHHLNWLTMRAAADAGTRVVLSGQDGDTTVYHGWQYFAELALQGRWADFSREAEQTLAVLRAEAASYSMQETWRNKRDVLNAYGSIAIKKWADEKNIVRLVPALFALQRHFDIAPHTIIKRIWKRLLLPRWFLQRQPTPGERKVEISPVVNPHLARRIDLQDRLRALQESRVGVPSVRSAQQETLASPYLHSSFEKLANYAAAFGIEARHPFMDKRLVEFCLGLPAEQSYSSGWTRMVMRRAMEGIVPGRIQWRVGKASLAAPYRHLLLNKNAGRIEQLLQNIGPAEAYVDSGYLHKLYARRNELTDTEVVILGRAVSVALWLQKRRTIS